MIDDANGTLQDCCLQLVHCETLVQQIVFLRLAAEHLFEVLGVVKSLLFIAPFCRETENAATLHSDHFQMILRAVSIRNDSLQVILFVKESRDSDQFGVLCLSHEESAIVKMNLDPSFYAIGHEVAVDAADVVVVQLDALVVLEAKLVIVVLG